MRARLATGVSLGLSLTLLLCTAAVMAAEGGALERAKKAYTEGLRLFAAGHEAEAMGKFHEAGRIEPGFADPYRALGTIHARAGRIGRMCLDFGGYLALSPHVEDAAKIYEETRKYVATTADCDFEEWVELPLGEPAVARPGSLAREAAAAVVAGARDSAGACVAPGTGTVLARLIVRKDGVVAAVEVRGLPARSPEEKCLAGVLRALRFPKSAAGSARVPAVFVF